MSETRVLFAALPAMLSEILREAAGAESDLRIMGECKTLEELAEAMEQAKPHVLVVGSDEAELPAECERLMFDCSHPGTLSVSRDGRQTWAYHLRPHGTRIENVSTEGVIDAIRTLKCPQADREA